MILSRGHWTIIVAIVPKFVFLLGLRGSSETAQKMRVEQCFPCLDPREMSVCVRAENANQVSFATRDVCSSLWRKAFSKKKEEQEKSAAVMGTRPAIPQPSAHHDDARNLAAHACETDDGKRMAGEKLCSIQEDATLGLWQEAQYVRRAFQDYQRQSREVDRHCSAAAPTAKQSAMWKICARRAWRPGVSCAGPLTRLTGQRARH